MDGSSMGNPGHAGCAVVLDGNGGRGRYLGVTTNNVAEYEALLDALRWARSLGAREVTVLTDSRLLWGQVTQGFKVRSPNLAKLAVEANTLASAVKLNLTLIPRAENGQADALARAAAKERRDVRR